MNEEVFEVIKAINRLKEKVTDLSTQIGEIKKTLPYVPQEYWDTEDTCKYLKISKRTLFKLKASRKISFIKTNRTAMFRPIDLDIYLEKYCLIKSLEKNNGKTNA